MINYFNDHNVEKTAFFQKYGRKLNFRVFRSVQEMLKKIHNVRVRKRNYYANTKGSWLNISKFFIL